MKKGILRRMIDKIKEFAIVISTTGKLAVGRLKNGGWKGTMLTLSSATAAAIAPTVLTACVNEPDVKIETITDKEKVESLVSENFSVENAVKDEMQKQFGKLENFTFENGVAKAVVTKDGEKYNAEVAINVDVNDFKVEKYNNAEVANDGSLHFYLDGKLTSEKVDGIVVEVGKDIYVVDPTDFYNEISMAVSDAISNKVETEKPDPENPGGEDKPDPDEPENPGGEENPDPDDPENPGGEDKPDPDEPENPGGEENPDPDEPENPGGEDKPDPDEPENPGGEENPDPDKPTEITFDSWEELMSAGDGVVQDAVFDILQTNLFTESVIKSMFGNDMTTANLNDGTIEILKWAFDINDSNEITAIEVMGTRTGFPANATRVRIETASFTLQTPIALDSIGADASNNDYTISYPDGEGEVTIDLSTIATGTINATYNAGFRHTVADQILDDTNQAYFDLCMPLAVEAGLINSDANIAFVNVQVSGGVIGSEFGNAINANLQFIDLNTNIKYNISILFADSRTNGSTTMLDEMKKSADSGEYRARSIEDDKTIISGDIIYEFEDALDGIVKYTIPAENQK